jgi:hypothetical protein
MTDPTPQSQRYDPPSGNAGGCSSGWQDMASAPKDGTHVDIWFRGYRVPDAYWGRPDHHCGEAGSYCDCCPSYDGWCDAYGYLTDEDGDDGSEPTHWMPLPAPPSVLTPTSEPEER